MISGLIVFIFYISVYMYIITCVQDGPAITQQLDQLNAAWAKLNTDALNRKHQLEDALLQLGQFHDALAQLLSWIADSTGKLSEAPPAGVKSEAVEMQLNELKV